MYVLCFLYISWTLGYPEPILCGLLIGFLVGSKINSEIYDVLDRFLKLFWSLFGWFFDTFSETAIFSIIAPRRGESTIFEVFEGLETSFFVYDFGCGIWMALGIDLYPKNDEKWRHGERIMIQDGAPGCPGACLGYLGFAALGPLIPPPPPIPP